jgi:hypothetical protein
LSDVWLKKIFSHSVGSLFNLVTNFLLLLLLCRSFLISCNHICWSFLLVAEPLELYWGGHCLCLLISVYTLLSPILASRFQVWY